MIKTTKEQRKALLAKFKESRVHSVRCVSNGLDFTKYEETSYNNYRSFRKMAKGTFGCDGAITVYWCNMWLCIEKDGYTHS